MLFRPDCTWRPGGLLQRSAGDTFARRRTALDAACGDADGDTPPPVLRHRLLEQSFRLNSKAFMLTFHSRSLSMVKWPQFLLWVEVSRRGLRARRWAACVEESEHSKGRTASAGATATPVHHTHAHLWWTDGIGLRRRSTDDLVFDGARPRVDVCMC